MFATLTQKELKAIILSPKFTASFAICSILILLSVFTGILEYQASVKQHEAAEQLVRQELSEATSWGNLSTKTYRAPDPMQIFVSGLTYDVGRWSYIDQEAGVKLRHSTYSDDPIFAVFRFADFAFIVMFVLSLIALQFTYDAVNGERESGTLRLVFSNAVPRAKYLLAKCAGSWLGLVIPLGIPILLSLLLVLMMGVPLTPTHWIKIAYLMGLSLLLFTLFIFAGVMISTLTRRSSVSFLIALMVWVVFVMIIPRAGVMAAGGLVNVPRVAEIESQRDRFANQSWESFYQGMAERWGTDCPSEEAEWERMLAEDSARRSVQQEINAFETRLAEDLRQRKIVQENLAWSLARFSPASAYQLATMALAETDTRNKEHNESAMSQYREQFVSFVDQKKLETGQDGGVRIALSLEEDGTGTLTVDASRSRSGLEVADVPRFAPPQLSLTEILGPTVIDFGILALSILLVFAIAFVAFLKYDVR